MIRACLITRDRAELVMRAIASVHPHVDHTFVYDTGSTDDTIERLSSMADVTVESGEWREDFAWAPIGEVDGLRFGWSQERAAA